MKNNRKSEIRKNKILKSHVRHIFGLAAKSRGKIVKTISEIQCTTIFDFAAKFAGKSSQNILGKTYRNLAGF